MRIGTVLRLRVIVLEIALLFTFVGVFSYSLLDVIATVITAGCLVMDIAHLPADARRYTTASTRKS